MQEQNYLAIGLFALAVGTAVAMVAGLVAKAVADVPREDRQYKNAPPLGFRLMWLPIQWISHFVGPLISARRYDAQLVLLRKAGLEYSLLPAQLLAAKLLCGASTGMVGYWVVGSFDAARSGGPSLPWGAYWQASLLAGTLGFLYPALWLRDHLARRRSELMKTLPFFLDIVTLCVEAGLNFQGAVNQAVSKGPRGALRDEFQRMLRDVRAGKARADALRSMAQRLDESGITNFCSAVIQAESMGMNLGPLLRAQADQRRSERFLRAEKLAMEAPVKMLFPLIAFIFPCTFIVLFFPIAMKFMHSGL